MKLIHLADLHIGRTFDMKSMLADQAHVLAQVTALAKERRPDAVLIAGDVFDRAVPKEEAVALYDRFVAELVLELAIPVVAIAGNHDSAGRLEGMQGLLSKAGYTVQGSLTRPLAKVTLFDEFGPVDLYLLPYKDFHGMRGLYEIKDTKEDGETLRRVLAPAKAKAGRKILMAHHYFSPSGEALDESDSERRLFLGGTDVVSSSVLEGFQYVALGHLHKAQRVGRDSIRYAGSLLKYSASEATHQKSITWVEMDGEGNVSIELLPVSPLRDLRRLKGSFQELMDPEKGEGSEDFLAVVLTDEERIYDAYARLLTRYPNIISLTYENIQESYELRVDSSALQKADTQKLFEDFFEEKNHRPMNPEEERFMAGVFEQLEEER
ncbi:Exonuclease SbcD [Clostridiaceae bacterium JG1575]|nr:Exonuclease SbcD [Clostridiaceae bacterium JG1575]